MKTLPALCLLLALVGCAKHVIDPPYVREWSQHRLVASCRVPEDKKYPLHVCSDIVGGPDDMDKPDFDKIPAGYRMSFYTDAPEGKPTGWVLKKGPCGDEDRNCSS